MVKYTISHNCEVFQRSLSADLVCASCPLQKYSHTVRMKRYAEEYLIRLKASGIKLAVATGLPTLLYMQALQNNRIHDLFDVLCSSDEVTRGKEFPDLFLHAAEKMGVAPADCIVFEDVFPAVSSARQAY